MTPSAGNDFSNFVLEGGDFEQDAPLLLVLYASTQLL